MVTIAMIMSMIDKWWDYLQRDHADKVWRYCGASLCKESNLLHFLLQVSKTHFPKNLSNTIEDRKFAGCTWGSCWLVLHMVSFSFPSSSPISGQGPIFSPAFLAILIVIEITLLHFQNQRCKVDWESKSATSEKSPRLIKPVKKDQKW